MGHCYRHLDEKDRIFLDHMLKAQYPKSKIAKILGVSRSTIYREINRNDITHGYSGLKGYDSMLAHKQAMERRQRAMRLQENDELRTYVHAKLDAGWSPWQIEGRLKREGKPGMFLTHETIYRYIYSDYGLRNRFFKKLRRKHFNRKQRHNRRSRFPRDLLIQHRPESINDRSEFGHWECDLMCFKRGVRANLITLRERRSRYMVAIKNPDKTARGTALTLIAHVKRLKGWIRSITLDQGSEFMNYRWLQSCLAATIYFCEPGSPQQKGAIENGNGVLRAELPRTAKIDAYQQKDIRRMTDEINHRPLRCLDYQTPAERFAAFTGAELPTYDRMEA